MRINNLFEFTEIQHFYTYRNFGLSPVDQRMLIDLYQPMVGGLAISLYQFLCSQLPGEQIGYTRREQLRNLFLTLGIELNEAGKQQLIELTSRLEAVGLLQSYRHFEREKDEYLYEFQLICPLSPDAFFENEHLVLFLRDQVGSFAVLQLKSKFYDDSAENYAHTAKTEELTVPFHELFRLNPSATDPQLQQALTEMAPSSEKTVNIVATGFTYEQIIMRFPKQADNRMYIEKLNRNQQQLSQINYIAQKYQLTLMETCRLLDEEHLFSHAGELDLDHLNEQASLLHRQTKRREVSRDVYIGKSQENHKNEQFLITSEKPVDAQFFIDVPLQFKEGWTIQKYNYWLKNTPYTHVLAQFYADGAVPDSVRDLCEKIDYHYKLENEVINVLIHFVQVQQTGWTNNFIDKIVANLLVKRVSTFEKAVEYFRETTKQRTKTTSRNPSTPRARTHSKKPVIPVVTSSESKAGPVSDEELAEILREARRLQGEM